jgi:hypothetical protein
MSFSKVHGAVPAESSMGFTTHCSREYSALTVCLEASFEIL